MRFSRRLPQAGSENTITRILQAKRAAGVKVLDLTESNPTHAGITYPAGLLAGLADPRALQYEPESFGLPAARQLVADQYGVPFSRVLLSASTSEAYSWIFKLLCDPGDEILIPQPSYPLFEYLAALENVTVKPYPLFYDHGWFIDFHALEQSLNSRTKAIVLVNPNNPTGHFLRQHELLELTELCSRHGIAILSDEVFADYQLHPAPDSVPTLRCVADVLTFCLNGLSKTVGLPQMKLAWMFVNGPQALLDDALSRLEVIADTYLSASTPVQLALPGFLAARGFIQDQILSRLHQNLALLRQGRLRILSVEAGWYAVAALGQPEEPWVEALLEQYNVLVQPGFFYDFQSSGYAVISLLTDPENFREGLARINNFH